MRPVSRSRPVIFGELLFDRFPDGSEVLGGAPFNVAWNLHGLGLDPLMISRVGDDELGEGVLEAMRQQGMDTQGIQIDPEHPTGTVQISLEDGEPRFEIVDRRAYDFIEEPALPSGLKPALLYHGSLALRHETSRESLRRLRESIQEPVFVDINLRPPWFDPDSLASMLQEATDLKLNEAELDSVAEAGESLAERVEWLRTRYALRRITVTRGADGASAFEEDGRRHDARPGTRVEVVDTVGAGDAFSSVLIAGRLRGWPIGPTLERAQALAGAVVGRRGATVEDSGFYLNFAQAWGLA